MLLWLCLPGKSVFFLITLIVAATGNYKQQSLLFFTEEFAFFSPLQQNLLVTIVSFYFLLKIKCLFFSARHLLFISLAMKMKFMCSATVSEKGRT